MDRERQREEMARRYPEIEAAGGLAALLRRELIACTGPGRDDGIEVTTPGSLYWAYLVSGDRSAQIACAVESALYLTTFWEGHVPLAHQRAPGLPALVAALCAWLVERVPASELAHRVPDVRLEDGATAYEDGPAAYVADRWAVLRSSLAEEAAEGRPWWAAELLALVDMAAADPLVGRMRPFTSLSRFGVWRGLGPDDGDSLPLVDPLPGAPGRFVLCTYEGAPLAEGTAHEVVALLAEHARAAGEPR